jgi:hypothetical protein
MSLSEFSCFLLIDFKFLEHHAHSWCAWWHHVSVAPIPSHVVVHLTNFCLAFKIQARKLPQSLRMNYYVCFSVCISSSANHSEHKAHYCNRKLPTDFICVPLHGKVYCIPLTSVFLVYGIMFGHLINV